MLFSSQRALMEIRMEDIQLWQSLVAWMESERERERMEVARTMHDELGQRLVVARFALADIGRRGCDDTAQLRQVLEESASIVRSIGMKLRPGVLDAAGLGAALEWQCAEFCRVAGVVCERSQIPPLIVDGATSIGLFRIAGQVFELVRESGAVSFEVVLWRQRGNVVLRISHNGSSWASSDQSRASTALHWVRERARMLGGKTHIKDLPSGGTTVTITVPIVDEART